VELKLKRESIRLKGYDYSKSGRYFVTICTHRRFKILGKIIGQEVCLDENGLIVKDEILRTEKMRHNILLDSFVIMPNHVHMILVIKNDFGAGLDNGGGAGVYCGEKVGVYSGGKVGAYCNTPLRKINLKSPKNNLGSIIRGIKSTTAKKIQEIKYDGLPIWQRNYYERIIRDEDEYQKIRWYMNNNAKLWEKDENNIEVG